MNVSPRQKRPLCTLWYSCFEYWLGSLLHLGRSVVLSLIISRCVPALKRTLFGHFFEWPNKLNCRLHRQFFVQHGSLLKLCGSFRDGELKIMVFRALSSSLNLKLLNLNYSDTKEKIMITLKVKLLRTSVKDRPTNQHQPCLKTRKPMCSNQNSVNYLCS